MKSDPTAPLWGGIRVPVTLLGGPLGSGKTTLLNRLLAAAHGRRLVVLVNDVGAIAVDAALIASATDDVIELTNGCVCCSMTDGLGEALEELRSEREPPDQVIVELSGVAEPQRVVPWTSTAGFRLDGVVVCVDAELIERQLVDRWMADTVRKQLGAADLLVLTKSDLVNTRPSLGGFTGAPLVDGASMSIGALLSVEPRHTAESRGPASGETGSDPTEWTVVARPLTGPVDIDAVRARLDDLPDAVIRIKGFLADLDGVTFVVQGVGARRMITSGPSSVEPSLLGLVVIATPDLSAAEAVSAMDRLLAP